MTLGRTGGTRISAALPGGELGLVAVAGANFRLRVRRSHKFSPLLLGLTHFSRTCLASGRWGRVMPTREASLEWSGPGIDAPRSTPAGLIRAHGYQAESKGQLTKGESLTDETRKGPAGFLAAPYKREAHRQGLTCRRHFNPTAQFDLPNDKDSSGNRS